jgi:C-terminal processing protease CtpA/Prc
MRNSQPCILFLLLLFSKGSFAQFPAHPDSIYTFIKYNSILRNTVDWKLVDESFHQEIATAKNRKDTMNCFVRVLKKLNDVHSQLYLDNQYYGHYPVFDDSALAQLTPLVEKSRITTNQILTSLFAKSIVYARVPGFSVYGSEQINLYAQALYDSVCQYASKKPKGFIIDLRLNGGGNIYPMLAGLSGLLGDGIVGYETDIDESIIRTWEIRNGNFFIGGYQSTSINQKQEPDLSKVPVVILIGAATRSSGSATAIAFRQRQHTLFIGEPTADGYTTSNAYFQFAPNLLFNFATNFIADRNKIVYKTTVSPDIIISHRDNFDNLALDKKIEAAIKWLYNYTKN